MIVLSNIKNLYTGTGANSEALLHDVDAVIDQHLIKDVLPHGKEKFADDHVVVDCSGYTITPGLIDCHAHITLFGMDPKNVAKLNTPWEFLYIEKVLYQTVVHGGVTCIRDVGGATDSMRRLMEDGIMIGPRMKIAICMLSSTGGHADFREVDHCCSDFSPVFKPGPGRPSSMVDGPWECRQRVREIASCGGDLIKICASPGVLSPGDKLENLDFSKEEIQAICDEAHARGMPVVAHAHTEIGIEMSIDCGVHDIQHNSFMTEALAKKASEKSVVVTPTAWINDVMKQDQNLTTFTKEKLIKASSKHKHSIKFALDAGLGILAGTDACIEGMHGKKLS